MNNLTEQEITDLKNTKNENDWSDACDRIKEARGGAYPSDWWTRIMLSGLRARIASGWADPRGSDIEMIPISSDALREGRIEDHGEPGWLNLGHPNPLDKK